MSDVRFRGNGDLFLELVKHRNRSQVSQVNFYLIAPNCNIICLKTPYKTLGNSAKKNFLLTCTDLGTNPDPEMGGHPIWTVSEGERGWRKKGMVRSTDKERDVLSERDGTLVGHILVYDNYNNNNNNNNTFVFITY